MVNWLSLEKSIKIKIIVDVGLPRIVRRVIVKEAADVGAVDQYPKSPSRELCSYADPYLRPVRMEQDRFVMDVGAPTLPWGSRHCPKLRRKMPASQVQVNHFSQVTAVPPRLLPTAGPQRPELSSSSQLQEIAKTRFQNR